MAECFNLSGAAGYETCNTSQVVAVRSASGLGRGNSLLSVASPLERTGLSLRKFSTLFMKKREVPLAC